MCKLPDGCQPWVAAHVRLMALGIPQIPAIIKAETHRATRWVGVIFLCWSALVCRTKKKTGNVRIAVDQESSFRKNAGGEAVPLKLLSHAGRMRWYRFTTYRKSKPVPPFFQGSFSVFGRVPYTVAAPTQQETKTPCKPTDVYSSF